MRLSECVFHLQEMAAASRTIMETAMEEETKKVVFVQCLALEMAAEKLGGMLPKNERDDVVNKKGAN